MSVTTFLITSGKQAKMGHLNSESSIWNMLMFGEAKPMSTPEEPSNYNEKSVELPPYSPRPLDYPQEKANEKQDSEEIAEPVLVKPSKTRRNIKVVACHLAAFFVIGALRYRCSYGQPE